MVQRQPAEGGLGNTSLNCRTHPEAYVTLGEVVSVRPNGITEQETWALLCQAVQALQDLFLSDGVSGGRFVPAVYPGALLLSARGRVTFSLMRGVTPPPSTTPFTAPEYRSQRAERYVDADIEKMLVYSLGECLKKSALLSHFATTRLTSELCRVLTAMGHHLPSERASLMHLLDVISEYSKRRDQVKPFSHTVMDLYRETIIYRNRKPLPNCNATRDQKQFMVSPCRNRNDLLTRRLDDFDTQKTIPNYKWTGLRAQETTTHLARTSFASSLEHLNRIDPEQPIFSRPKSICTNEDLLVETPVRAAPPAGPAQRIKRHHMKRNPVKRAASRLYQVADNGNQKGAQERNCVGPEFVIRASLPSKQLFLNDIRICNTSVVTVIMLNGVKLEINCKPELLTAGQLFEHIIRSEGIEENYFLGLSVLISGDFVFLPSDVKLSKIVTSGASDTRFTLFVRIRFFLPSLRGIRSLQSKHLLYLQLRRSLLENQLPCSMEQLYDLGGLALQAEFGDYTEKHESSHYFLLEHYLPENLIGNPTTNEKFRHNLSKAHFQRSGLSVEKAEEDFILLAQSLPHYGVHFYSAILVSKNTQRDVWLCVSAQGITLFERTGCLVPHNNPLRHEMFQWQDIQTLCYSKQYLCIIPHNKKGCKPLPKKYKLKMDHKKSYYTFRLASLHHQFFLRLRTEYSSLQSLSQQFGILLKDIKNEANSLFKFASTAGQNLLPNIPSVANPFENRTAKCKRSKSVHELNYSRVALEEYQNKENENPKDRRDKRKGVKMGTRAFASSGFRKSRSLEAVNAWATEEAEKVSSQSSSRLSNNSSIPQNADIYVLDSSIKSLDDQFLPDFHETLSQSLLDKLKNLSFAEERILKTVTVHRDPQDSLGIQVTEGSDGKIYIQSVVPFGPASNTGNVFKGDQIIAVDGQNLLNLKYADALQILKKTEDTVEFILSQGSAKQCFESPKVDNSKKCDFENADDDNFFGSNFYCFNKSEPTKDCLKTFPTTPEKRYNLLPMQVDPSELYNISTSPPINYQAYPGMPSLPPYKLRSEPSRVTTDVTVTSPSGESELYSERKLMSVSQVPLPRSLGLGRRWRGPVRYPVTPIKEPLQVETIAEQSANIVMDTTDEEQIFFI